MKLAFCLFNYFPFGGLQRDFYRIAMECVRRGHQVDVYTMQWQGDIPPELSVTILFAPGWQNHTRIKHFSQQVQAATNAKQYDCVVGFNKMPGLDVYYAADTCFQARTRAKHGLLYRLTPRYRHLFAFEKTVFAKGAKTDILLIAPKQQSEFEQYYQTEKSRFHLLPPGLERHCLAPDNAAVIRQTTRQELNLSETDFLLLFVGSGFKTKGLDRVINGLSALPDTLKTKAHLYIIGRDNAVPFQRQAKKAGLADRVKFLGGRSDVSRFMLAADLLVHPAYNENTGTVLLEALASGLPVLTTDVCGYADYVRDARAGRVLASPFQQSAFNDALVSILSSDERLAWRNNGVKFARETDIYSMIERAVDMIESR